MHTHPVATYYAGHCTKPQAHYIDNNNYITLWPIYYTIDCFVEEINQLLHGHLVKTSFVEKISMKLSNYIK